ncbi:MULTISPECIES: SUKH-3 domain-containing protein [unclassified Nocardia]|uniref:SUKH-3 domain-containing protein n=1 Tax=unclassified Nocardia TaxID=2637762 RepID=UPI0033A47833
MGESELGEFLGSFGSVAGVRADAEAVIGDLERVGFACHKAGRSFLRGYLGLRIDHGPDLVIAGEVVRSWTSFDPSVVCTARDADVARRCAEVAGADLVPIGVDSFHLTLYSGSDGRFYAGFDSSVYRYGDDVSALFSMMKEGIRPIVLGEWVIR